MVVLVLLFGRSPRLRALLAAVLVGLALVLVPTRVVPPGWPPTGWAVVACDVGQGDALVLATGQPGWAVLVDAGPDDGPVDACLDRLGVQGIALVVLSHLHADHIGGLAGALRGRAVAGIAVGPVTEPRWALREVARRARTAGVPLVASAAGQRLRWPGLVLDVIGPRHPGRARPRRRHRGQRRLAGAARRHPGRHACCSPATSSWPRRPTCSAPGCDLRADVLKMPHHGSRYTAAPSSSPRSRRAPCWSASGRATATGTPTPALLDRLERGRRGGPPHRPGR